jgi:branched-subunit amino acid ABC-type transport system permease component
MSDRLRAIRDLAVGDWSLDAVDAAVQDALSRERAHPDNRERRATMNIATVLAMSVAVLVALAVAVVAIGALGRRDQPVRVPATTGSSVVLARAFRSWRGPRAPRTSPHPEWSRPGSTRSVVRVAWCICTARRACGSSRAATGSAWSERAW